MFGLLSSTASFLEHKRLLVYMVKNVGFVWLHMHFLTCCKVIVFVKSQRSPGCSLGTSHGARMWIAWGGSCWSEASWLSISFTHDARTPMLSFGPEGRKRNAALLHSLLFLCLKSEEFYICTLLLYVQSASAHADQVCMPSGTKSRPGVQHSVVFLLRLLAATDKGGL